MKENGHMISDQAQASACFLTTPATLESITMTVLKELAATHGLMDLYMRANGQIAKWKVKEHIMVLQVWCQKVDSSMATSWMQVHQTDQNKNRKKQNACQIHAQLNLNKRNTQRKPQNTTRKLKERTKSTKDASSSVKYLQRKTFLIFSRQRVTTINAWLLSSAARSIFLKKSYLYNNYSSTLSKQEVYKFLEENVSQTVEEIDFRQTVTEYETPKNRKDIKAGLKQKLLKVVKAGGVIIFNMDDSSCKYTAKYDPDYKEFYDRGAIHQHVWDPEKLLQKEVWSQYSGTESLPISPYTV
eukprot:TRINITY_DN64999_c0_g1_i1.p1 TRINITY_DN64999_c0_g1~~TRINITY_DN64999_c0_g1_i1.p1  ORF type:complete len:299 (-),score=14.97 TRINITY_DN64999_c0_g1_i1:279-1175(-)